MKSRVMRVSALAGLAVGTGVQGAVLSWNLAGSGNANAAGTWSPAQVPVAGDVLNYNLAGFHSVNFNGVSSVAQQNFNAGQYSLANSIVGGHTTTQQIVVGLTAGSNSTLAFSQGIWNCTGTFSVGGNATGVGVCNVLSGSVIVTGAANIARIGNTGNGTLNVGLGALFSCEAAISIGKLAGSNGTAAVSGVNGTPSEMRTTGTTTGDLFVGELGPGVLNVEDGGLVTVADDLFIAPNAGVTGTASAGSTTSNASVMSVAGDLLIGANAAAAAAGTGRLNINNGAIVNVPNGTVRVGDPDGGTGTLFVNDAALDGTPSLSCQSLIFDTTGHGLIDFRDGHIEIRGGTFVPPSPALNFSMNGVGGATRPTLEFDAGSSATFGTLGIGTTDDALVTIGGGSTVTSGAITIAQNATSTSARLQLRNGQLNFPGATMTVGNQGDARFDIDLGGDATGGSINIANIVGSVSSVTVSGAGSTLTLTGDITMSTAGSTGTPTLAVSNSGVITAAGNINANSDHAIVSVDGGTINATDIILDGTATLTGTGRVNADISPSTEPSTNIVLTGPLDLGRDGVSGTVAVSGITTVGVHALTVRGTSFARLGDITIDGGVLNSTGCEIQIASGDSLTGFGTVNAPFAVAGNRPVTATGTGLTFNNSVSQFITTNPMNFSGTTFTFGPACAFTGKGTIAAQVIAQTGSVVTATGDLTLGANISLGCLLNSATLHVGTHHVTLIDSNGGSVGLADLGGGTLELVGTASGHNLNTSASGHLSGHGTIITPKFRNIHGGQISPGATGASGVGLLSFSGTYDSGDTLNPAGTVNIELGGALPNQFDQLDAAGSVTLDGTLNVSLINGYVPQPGVFHDIISSSGGFVLGEFDVRNMPAGFVRVFINGAYSIGLPCIADVDDGEGGGRSDGGVTIDDLLYYLTLFEAGDIEADVDDGSGTGTPDGGVTIDDLLFFLEHFELGC